MVFLRGYKTVLFAAAEGVSNPDKWLAGPNLRRGLRVSDPRSMTEKLVIK